MLSAGHQPPNPGIAAPKRTLSVRVRLMVLAVIAVVPLLAERIYSEELDRSERIEAAQQQALVVARQGAAAQNEVIVSARALLQTIASARTTFDASNEKCNLFLATIAKPIPWIKTLSVVDLQGKIVCSSFPGAIGLDISKRAHFTAVIDSGDFYVSDYIVGARIKSPAITASLAQRDVNGATTAVVLGLLDLNWFEHVAKTFVPPTGSMLMIDGTGTVLAQYPNGDDLVGREFKDHPLIQAMLAQPEGFIVEPALDGVRRIFGYVKLPGTQARFAVGFDEKTVLTRVNREMWAAFAELGAIVAFALLGIWFGGERLLVRPILALAQTAARIGRGESETHATALPWAAEFVPLAVAMDDMAGQLNARAQELHDANDQLRELAQIDALTGLPNRRTFNERLRAEWKLAAKLGQPIAVLMIDVDFFKKFNDHYGHVQGDTCLRKVSGVLMAATRARSEPAAATVAAELPPSFHRIAGRVRRSDFAARYGGEEFAVLLQGADYAAAMRVAERLRQGVENMLMAHAGAPWGFVSVSIGVGIVARTEQSDSQALVEVADAALYEAKRQGRNRVVGPAAVALSEAV
jgi:GGDEF domain-containing protein